MLSHPLVGQKAGWADGMNRSFDRNMVLFIEFISMAIRRAGLSMSYTLIVRFP